MITGDHLRVSHAGGEVAVHEPRLGRFERVVDPAHLAGVAGFGGKVTAASPPTEEPALLRPLLEYERVIGGS